MPGKPKHLGVPNGRMVSVGSRPGSWGGVGTPRVEPRSSPGRLGKKSLQAVCGWKKLGTDSRWWDPVPSPQHLPDRPAGDLVTGFWVQPLLLPLLLLWSCLHPRVAGTLGMPLGPCTPHGGPSPHTSLSFSLPLLTPCSDAQGQARVSLHWVTALQLDLFQRLPSSTGSPWAAWDRYAACLFYSGATRKGRGSCAVGCSGCCCCPTL